MPLIDNRGRVFGRLNLIDAAAVAFVLVLLPLAYGAYLLFRPSAPEIESVSRAEVTREERRIAGGVLLAAKLKVRGSGFNPMLRAEIGGTPAMGFVFESPNSADVLVGPIAAGTHDLVLFDGVQEVARAKGAVTIAAPPTTSIRLAGRFIGLEDGTARALKVDSMIVMLGALEPARARVRSGQRVTELPVQGRVERPAVVEMPCDPAPAGSETSTDPCTVGGQSLTSDQAVIVTVASAQGSIPLLVEDVLPAGDAQRASARVLFTGGDEIAAIRAGDRDAFLDNRAAVVTAVSARERGSMMATLDLGVDASREGWRYRGQLVVPGSTLTLTTSSYVAAGRVQDLNVTGANSTQTK
jgi:hypothetical protein